MEKRSPHVLIAPHHNHDQERSQSDLWATVSPASHPMMPSNVAALVEACSWVVGWLAAALRCGREGVRALRTCVLWCAVRASVRFCFVAVPSGLCVLLCGEECWRGERRARV